MQIGGGNAPGIPRDVFVGGRTSSESGGTAGWGTVGQRHFVDLQPLWNCESEPSRSRGGACRLSGVNKYSGKATAY